MSASAFAERVREDLIAPDPLLDCLIEVCRIHGQAATRASLTAGLPLAPQSGLGLDLVERAASRAGMATRLQRIPTDRIDPNALPVILVLKDRRACVLLGRDPASGAARVLLPESGQGEVKMPYDVLRESSTGLALYVRPRFRFDARAPEVRVRRRASSHWFWGAIRAQRFVYRDVLWAALLVNLFALALPMFTMNVYDRVVPNHAVETLWALSIGVGLVLLADLWLRKLRSRFVDEASARVDVQISATLMERVLGMKLENRPESVGSFAANLRGFEQVRDLIASGTVTAFIDLPFALLFLGVIVWIAPWLALPVAVGFLLVIGTGWLLQSRLHELAESTWKASAQRNATLVESLGGIETIKSQGAENLIQARWERANTFLAATNVKMRALTSSATYGSNALTQAVTVVIVIIGVYLIADRQLTMGALIAVSMLAGRALAPAGQIVGLLMQYQGARTALEALEKIMDKPVERPDGATFVQRPVLKGDIEFRQVTFNYPGRSDAALDGMRAGGADRARGLGQVDDPAADSGPVHAGRGCGADRRDRPAPARPCRPAPQPRLRVAGRHALLRHAAREHHLRRAACGGRRGGRRERDRRHGRPRQPASQGLRHGRRRAWRIALGRTAAVGRHRPRRAAQRADPAARRADERNGLFHRGADHPEARRLRRGQDGGAGHPPHLAARDGAARDRGRQRPHRRRRPARPGDGSAAERQDREGGMTSRDTSSSRGGKRSPKAQARAILAAREAAAADAPGFRPFELDADAVMSRRDTQRAQWIVRAALISVLALIAWAWFARVEEVTRGEGRVVPSRQLQVVQSLDGGVVSEILVREGDVVEAGQMLLKIDETRATSGVRENAAQGFALRARQARLRALAEGSRFDPPKVSARDAEELRIIEEERRLYESRLSELNTLLSINQQQLQQRQQELAEMRARKAAAERSLELSQQELTQTRPLLATGAVSQMDILRVEREVSRSRGDSEQAAAQIQRVQAAIGEAQRKSQETELSFRNEARKELADVMGRLNALTEGAVALTDRVDKSQVKSPVRGRVQRLLANTIGGVVQPGKDIVEIVPLDDTLVLEARVLPRDIGFIVPGQSATVKFTAYDFSIYGGMDATVENISPDTVTDERGNAFYLVRVRTKQASFGEKLPIIPGMTAEVDILTGDKTVLSYLLKPVLKAKSYALSER
jgi:ATP-binding cassette, subfamily C, bacterial LapB